MATINDAKLIAAPYNFNGNTIYRFALPGYAADPATPATLEIWHNNTTGKLKVKLPSGIKNLIQSATEVELGAAMSSFGPTDIVSAVLSNILGRLDLAETGTGGKLKPAVDNLVTLKGLDVSNGDEYPDKCFLLVEDSGLYRLDRDADPNVIVEDLPAVVLPDGLNGGVWYKMADRLNDHAMLTGLQGGTAGEFYHLTADEKTWVEDITDKINIINTAGEYVEIEFIDPTRALLRFIGPGPAFIERIEIPSKLQIADATDSQDAVTLNQLQQEFSNRFTSGNRNIVANTWTTFSHGLGSKSIDVAFYFGNNTYDLAWRYKASSPTSDIEVFSTIDLNPLTIEVHKKN